MIHLSGLSTRRDLPRTLLRSGAAIVVALAVGWVTFTVSVAGVFRNLNPTIAIQYGGGDAEALGNRAEQLMRAARTPSEVQLAGSLARAAIKADPTVVDAYQVLGLIAANQDRNGNAAKLFQYASSLTRRDSVVEGWLIMYEARQNNIAGVLEHFDRVLSVNVSARPRLIPALVAMLADPYTVKPIAATLAHPPNWRREFLRLAGANSASLENLGALYDIVNRSDYPIERPFMQVMISRLVSEKKYALAAHHYEVFTHSKVDGSVRNGDFETDSKLVPFDWDFGSKQNEVLSRVPDPVNQDNTVIGVSYSSADPIRVRQLIRATPGSYVLSGRSYVSAAKKASMPAWALICADNDVEIGSAEISPQTDRWRTFSTNVDVPASNCAALWLTLKPSPNRVNDGSEVYFDDLRMARADG